MGKDLIGYDTLVDAGLRSVVRAALNRVAREGWPGTHHAYITFRTDAPGVEVPDALRGRHPHELTIVLQHQFWDLEVGDESFAVTLSFNKVGQRLTVPYTALTSYADPTVKFGLQFRQAEQATGERKAPEARGIGSVPQAGGADSTPAADGDALTPEAGVAPEARGDESTPEARGDESTPEAGGDESTPEAREDSDKVVTLDRFRKN